jgi:hypothetical protein
LRVATAEEEREAGDADEGDADVETSPVPDGVGEEADADGGDGGDGVGRDGEEVRRRGGVAERFDDGGDLSRFYMSALASFPW